MIWVADDVHDDSRDGSNSPQVASLQAINEHQDRLWSNIRTEAKLDAVWQLHIKQCSKSWRSAVLSIWQHVYVMQMLLQETEPLLASFLHTNILAHPSLGKALSHLLASKMQSRTLLGTQLMRLIFDAYQDDPVSAE